jgi:predicted RNA-binding Zn-ribbon protein involved in translation (DUF1610 family)
MNYMGTTKYVCRDCDFTFYIGVKKLKKKLFCPSCGENTHIEKCEVHRKHWTTKELSLVDKIIDGELSKMNVARSTGRTYGAVQRVFERRKHERGLM